VKEIAMYPPSFAIPVLVGVPWNDGATVFALLALFGLAGALLVAALGLRHRSTIHAPSDRRVRLARCFAPQDDSGTAPAARPPSGEREARRIGPEAA
jgi:hypothetical protein